MSMTNMDTSVWPPRLTFEGIGDTETEEPEQEGDYPQSQPSSQPCSPTSNNRSAMSDASSPSFIADCQRICWSGSRTNAADEVASAAASAEPEQPRLLGAAAAAAARLAASVAGGELEAPFSWEASTEVEEVQIQTASMSSDRGTQEISTSGLSAAEAEVPISPMASTFGDDSSLRNTSSEEAFVMTYGDYKQMWSLSGHSMSAASSEARSMGLDLVDMDMLSQGPNSRACDEVLKHGGQPFVVRGAEALAEAQRLEALRSLTAAGLSNLRPAGVSDAEAASYQLQNSDPASGSSSSSAVPEQERGSCGSFIDADSAERSRSDSQESMEIEGEHRPTAADLRQGLSVLRNLSLEIEEERRRRDESGSQQVLSDSKEVQDLKHEVLEGRAQCSALRDQISYSEDIERRYAATVTELRAELQSERKCLQAQSEMAASAESAAAAARAREASLASRIREEVSGQAFAEARAEAAATTQKLEAALAAASGQEASADVLHREQSLRSALSAAEQQRQLDEARQEAEKQQLLARLELLAKELEIERQGAMQRQVRLKDAETDATALRNENRRLQAELLSECSAATAAAVEASAAATAAASSAAALEERSRAQCYSISSLESPAIPSFARRLLQDTDSLTATPVSSALLRSSLETPALLRSRGLLMSQAINNEVYSDFQDGMTPPRRRGATPQKPLRLPNAGDVAAGGAEERALARLVGKDFDSCKSSMEEPDAKATDDSAGYVSTPFRGGPLGLARALALRNGVGRSKSPLRRG